jgi:gamma-glutamyltranspeptidase/glutathione hydrolase
MRARRRDVRWVALVATVLLAACTLPSPAPPAVTAGAAPPSAELLRLPEAATGFTRRAPTFAARQMVAAAHPLAADAGLEILRAGGSAVDAAVAVQMVLTLVEPQSSGIGGGAFLLHWDGREVEAWDGRETAPAAADERLFLRVDGRPLDFDEAAASGLAVGVPGAVRMLEAVHLRHGALPWARLFEPAIRLADAGFPVGPRLHALVAAEPRLAADPQARAHFLDAEGRPWPVGHRMRNPALAAVLRAIARDGSAALHHGVAADDIVRRAGAHPVHVGRLTTADLAAYRPLRREPICTEWRASVRVCGMPPPSSGHLAVMQILGMLERIPGGLERAEDGIPGAGWLHRYGEASRLAFADRAAWVADPDFVDAPGGRWTRLLDDDYLKRRAALVGPRAAPAVAPGHPEAAVVAVASQPEQPEDGTSHLSIVDAQGRAVAMTTTIEGAFGARLMSDGGTGLPGGFLLNHQLTDFAFVPRGADGAPVANRVQPGKRPRSSMSPTLVFDRSSGRLLSTLGSPGGAMIIHFTARTLLATQVWGLPPQGAVEAPNFGLVGGPLLLERGRFDAALQQAVRELGHEVREGDLTSGIHLVQRAGAGWAGAADPRREGVASGD